ncbi:MAG TPA: HutD family protein [Arenimonas sp.]|nr:HutD family protein [Arenimonas sp.]
MRSQLLPAHEYRRVRWKNQLGWTREIHCEPAEDWDWRISIAEVDQDGPFSAFPGCDRELVLLAGEGMDLHFDDGETVELRPRHDSHRFAGERPLHATLPAGPTQDFNVIWKRDRVSVQVLHRPVVGAMVFFDEPAVTWLVHVLSGHVTIKDPLEPVSLGHGDSALLHHSGGVSRMIIDGGGEVLLVKVERLAQP